MYYLGTFLGIQVSLFILPSLIPSEAPNSMNDNLDIVMADEAETRETTHEKSQIQAFNSSNERPNLPMATQGSGLRIEIIKHGVNELDEW